MSRLLFALTIFLGAFLLFQVQPLIGKYILPWFGGTPAVWTTCMLFFQLALLGGYGYAHLTSCRLSPRHQAWVHLGLLLGALALLPITPSDAWKPPDSAAPTLRILALLSVSIGLPYLVLSTTGPLLQAWFRLVHPGPSPYRFYALSNLGSLLALVSYPFWFEIHFSRRSQAEWWSWGLVLYAILCGACAWRVGKLAPGTLAAEAADTKEVPRPVVGHYLLWLLLPACGSVVLLATTNKLCQDVAVIPFLWVLPLGLYLLTFVLCFDSPRWYSRVGFGVALVPSLAAVVGALFEDTHVTIEQQILIYSGALLVCCMVCHGELNRLKPHPRFLTLYYLMIAAGGALGGLFVAVIAPRIFATYVELHWGLGLCLLLLVIVCALDKGSMGPQSWRIFAMLYLLLACAGLDRALVWLADWCRANSSKPGWDKLANLTGPYFSQAHWMVWILLLVLAVRTIWKRKTASPGNWQARACALLVVALFALGTALAIQSWLAGRNALSMARNFYGVLTVWENDRDTPEKHHRLLQHGHITHGLQLLDPDSARWSTTYYGETSGIGLALLHGPPPENRHIGVVGLGTGTLAAYGQAGDRFRFYEINPDVQRIAQEQFSYLAQSPAHCEVIIGDARLSLEREPSQQFDLLALDAFSSDAIPVHLLTQEALAIYLRHLKPEGILAVHISNCYLNLAPVVSLLAARFRLESVTISDVDDGTEWWHYASTWVLLTRNASFLNLPEIREAASDPDTRRPNLPLWTDDYASLFPLLE